MELFRLLGTIAVDNSGANSAISETTGSAEQSQSKISNAFGKIGSAAVKLGKVMATGLAVGAVAITAIGKQALDSYADFEQLVGGVETLFKESADIVQGYADNAYKSAGLSANEYMETVTSFSASLLQSLNGDTAKAAEKANQAIVDMSDNANKMGSSMESIQNAYQGFAKQNYTMLDNLKLGYGGTKEEMQRLLNDAKAISGITYDIDSYADVVDAIHVIQEEMGIAGTTALEASSTISGSFSSMKSAWKNLLTGLGNEDADLSGLIDNFVDSASTVADNVLPRVEIILGGIADAIGKIVPKIAQKLPQLLQATLPSLIKGAVALLNGLVAALPEILGILLEQIPFIVSEIGMTLIDAFPILLETIQELLGQVIDFIGEGLFGVSDVSESAFGLIGEKFDEMLAFWSEVWATVGQPIWDMFIDTVTWVANNFSVITTGVSAAFATLWSICGEWWNASGKPIWDSILGVFNSLKENSDSIFPAIQTAFQVLCSLFNTAWTTIGQPIWDMITFAITSVAGLFAENMPAIMAFFNNAIQGIKDTWENHLKPVFEAIGAFLNDVIKPIFEFVWEKFISPLIKGVFETIGNLWTNTLKPVFDGICDFLTGIFTGSWEDMKDGIISIIEGLYEGVKTIFLTLVDAVKDPINTIIGLINGMISGVTDGINSVINALNSLQIDVPDWVTDLTGIDSFGFDLDTLTAKQIPLLARGGVLEKGQVGLLEGNGAEAVVPLENNREWIGRVADDMQAQGIGGGNDALYVLHEILAVLHSLKEDSANLPDTLVDAIANGLIFNINNREFARLVRAV